MTKNQSNRVSSRDKEILSLHKASGLWCKKVKGKRYYFGRDKAEAIQRYLRERDDLEAGRSPRPESVTVEYAVNHFLTRKQGEVDNGELAPRSFSDYLKTSQRIVRVFGRNASVESLSSDDFARLRADIAQRWGNTALGNEINRVRIVFKYAYDEALIDAPIRYGRSFDRPSKRILRRDRASKPKKLFTASEVHQLLSNASLPMKAMILLGINVGMGNRDVAMLREAHVDIQNRWIDFPRPKTGVERTAVLWPATIEALQVAREVRPDPKDKRNDDLFFITRQGNLWVKDDGSDNAVTKEFSKLLKECDLVQHGRGFYGLRHTFETIGQRTRDQQALDHVMGHADSSMSAVYREEFDRGRLEAVAEVVRSWCFDANSVSDGPDKLEQGNSLYEKGIANEQPPTHSIDSSQFVC